MSWRRVAPAGAPIRARDLARWVARVARDGDPRAALEARVTARFGVPHAIPTSTGRAGLSLLLQAMRSLAPAVRTEVIVPAYTCYSVPASVLRAGLVPRPVDVDPVTLDYDPEALERTDASRAVAILATNLFGLPNDLPRIAAFARRHGAALVDDAAQAMGASVSGRASGTWGDAGLFSFDKGKNVSAIDGGLVVVHQAALAAAVRALADALPEPPAPRRLTHVVKALAYAGMLHPWVYGLPSRIPGLGLGRTPFTTDIVFERMDPNLAALAVVMLDRLEAFTADRTRNADLLRARLGTCRGISLVRPIATATPVHLRLPLLVDDAARRDALLSRLQAIGIGATGSYPQSLVDVPDLRPSLPDHPPAPGARSVAARIVTLPTHSYLGAGDIDRVVAVIGEPQRWEARAA